MEMTTCSDIGEENLAGMFVGWSTTNEEITVFVGKSWKLSMQMVGRDM